MPNPPWQWDELLLACALVVRNGWRELREHDPEVARLSELLQGLPLHPPEVREDRFRSPGSVSRKATDLATVHPSYHGRHTRGSRLDKEVVEAFVARPAEMLAAADRIRGAASEGALPASGLEDGGSLADLGLTALEGRLLAHLHHRRERDPKLRRHKIRTVQAAGHPLACEVCQFDFEQVYGRLGSGYIEVHHVLPLHVSGLTGTSLNDLALLCANCHRMCHRSPSTREPWRTPAELRDLIRSPH